MAAALRFAALAVGGFHTCGLTAAGAAYCWGANPDGQLGDSSTTIRPSPAPVKGGISFSALSAGFRHTCGVTATGILYCWGQNDHGQVGDGSTVNRTAPVRVTGDVKYSAVTAGGSHSCGITAAGVAYCWGGNHNGQLGDGTTTDRGKPAAVARGVSFAALEAGEAHTCGVTAAGAAWCWGSNLGQLGDGTQDDRLTPVSVSTAPDAGAVALDRKSTPAGNPLEQLAGHWGLEAFVMGAGQFGGPTCGKGRVTGGAPVTIAVDEGAIALGVSCDNSSDYTMLLRYDSTARSYLLTVHSRPGINVDDLPVTYADGQGWQGRRDQLVDGATVSVSAFVAPIEGRRWIGWMIAVLPTAGIGHSDDLKQPYFRMDLTKAKP